MRGRFYPARFVYMKNITLCMGEEKYKIISHYKVNDKQN